MTHLIIELNTIPENVTSNVIHKLYETAKAIIDAEEANEVEESLVSLKGNLLVSKAYKDEVDWLEAKFPNLHINVTGGLYFKFEDPEVLRVLLANNWGDGSGVTTTDILSRTSIPSNMFKNNTTVVSFNELQLMPNITSIQSSAFIGCSNLSSINLSNILEIANDAFLGCSSLTQVDASSVISFGQNVFQNCSNLQTISLPDSLSVLPLSILRNCSNLTTITGITNSPTSFGNGAFLDCNNLVKTFDLSSTMSVGDDTFKRCRNCTFSNFSTFLQNVTSIGNSAFEECLISGVLTLPNCTRFGSNPFNKCSVVIEIHAPRLTSCSGSFSTITVFDAPKLGGVSPSFSNNTNLTTLILDFDNITEIPNWGWNNCTSLTGTFDFAKLLKVGAQAFNNGNYNIVIRRTEAVCEFIDWGNLFGTFSGTIYVPDSLLSDYRSHAEWSKVPDPTNLIKGISELPSS